MADVQEAFLCAALRGGLQEALAVAGRGTPPPIFSDATLGRASLLVCSLRVQTHKAATRAGACRALPGRQRGTLMRVLVALSALGLSAISTVVKLLMLCVEVSRMLVKWADPTYSSDLHQCMRLDLNLLFSY